MIRAPLFALALVASARDVAASPTIEIERAWCASPPKGATTGACYLTLRNAAATPDRIVGVETDAANRIELHQTKIADGVGRMRPLSQGVAIPAGAVLDFAQQGYHLMLIDLKAPLAAGAGLSATLRFERAEPRTVLFRIGRPDAEGRPR